MRKLKKDTWPYQVTTRNLDTKIDKWCEECLGYRFRNWYSYFTNNEERVFAFKDSEALLVFKLKWKHNDKVV